MQSTYDPSSFPTPSIPLAPVLSSKTLKLAAGKQSAQCASILDIEQHRFVTSGRAAIALALEQSGIGAGDEVMVAAYHCESMISPIRWRGATPVYYQVGNDTAIDNEDIEKKLTGNTRAIIVTHYFGFQQSLKKLRELCDDRGIKLIEDCAHAFFGCRDGIPIGSVGDYAIASSMKFFPVYDGGILASNTESLQQLPIHPPPLKIQLKSLINIVEKSISYRRLGPVGQFLSALLRLKDYGWGLTKSARKGEYDSGPASSDGGYGLDENWIHKRSTWTSKKLILNSNLGRIAEKRRANFTTLHQAFADLPGSRPLFNNLPTGCVPLIYPLCVEDSERHFPALKQLGVPIWRFGEYLEPDVDTDEFQTCAWLSRHVLQFPCHQELKDHELQWMIGEVRNSLLG